MDQCGVVTQRSPPPLAHTTRDKPRMSGESGYAAGTRVCSTCSRAIPAHLKIVRMSSRLNTYCCALAGMQHCDADWTLSATPIRRLSRAVVRALITLIGAARSAKVGMDRDVVGGLPEYLTYGTIEVGTVGEDPRSLGQLLTESTGGVMRWSPRTQLLSATICGISPSGSASELLSVCDCFGSVWRGARAAPPQAIGSWVRCSRDR
jgi:hypothetical protein